MRKEGKRKALAALVCGSMLTVALVGGTLAYLTDTDSDVNTMTVGNVDIAQHEYQRVVDANGDYVKGVEGEDFTADYGISESYKLQEFTQDKPAMPAVYANGNMDWDESQQLWNGVGAPGSNDLFDDSMKNVIDKFVFVENTGKSVAFYRTIIAIEAPEGLDDERLIHASFNANSRFDYNDDVDGAQNAADSDKFYTTIDGVRYLVYTATYTEKLAPGEVSRPSLLQLYLDPAVTNEDCALFDNEWEVLVASQAVQIDGFADADAALDEAFGDISEINHPWINGFESTVTNYGELTKAMQRNGTIEIPSDLEGKPIKYLENAGKNIEINGNGTVLNSGTPTDYGFIAAEGSVSTLNNLNLISAGGGVGATGGAKVEVNNTNVAVNTTSTSGRYNFYAVGEGTEITINGGNFSFSKTLNQKRCYIYAGPGATVTVNGGNFGPASTRSGYTAGILGEGNVIIKGGTFGFDPSNWVAAGYQAVKSGSIWTVSPLS